MNILICDDSNEDALQLKDIIIDSRPNTHVSLLHDGMDVFEFFDSGILPDVCFLDIIMPKINGIDLAEKLRGKGYLGHIVFLTNSSDYAVQSYKVKAFSYLLKPAGKEEVAHLLDELETALKAADTGGIRVKTRNLFKFLLFKEISHAEVIGRTVVYRLTNGDEVKERARFLDITPVLLADSRFAQCHRSFVVNMDDVYKIENNNVVMNSGKNIPITKTYAEFYDKYSRYILGGDRFK